MRISDGAVEAACEAVSKSKGRLKFEDSVRLALEAAAPHLMAQAWDECANSLVYEDGSKVEIATNTNPYRRLAKYGSV